MSETNFDFAVEEAERGALTLVVRGDLDAYTGARFNDCVCDALSKSPGDLAMDMKEVAFVDSSGIAILVAAAKELRERGQQLVIKSPPRMLVKLLEMTGVTKLVRIDVGRR